MTPAECRAASGNWIAQCQHLRDKGVGPNPDETAECFTQAVWEIAAQMAEANQYLAMLTEPKAYFPPSALTEATAKPTTSVCPHCRKHGCPGTCGQSKTQQVTTR